MCTITLLVITWDSFYPRIQELQQDVTKLKLDLERAQGGIKHLHIQVEERDKEIERLSRALDGGRPYDVISLEAQTISNEKLIAHLNLQVRTET